MRKSILTICLLLLTTTAFAQADLQKVRINDFSGGMVTNILADILQPNQSVLASNVEIAKKGIISKRKGQALFASDVNSAAFTGLGRFDPDPSTSFMVMASGSSIATARNASSNWTVINTASPFSVGYATQFVQANDLLFILNGSDRTAWWDGSVYTQGNDWGNASPPTGTTAAWLRNYLFIAGRPGTEDWIYVSTNLEPKLYDADDIVKVNTGDGQAIKHLEPYRLNELIAYKERSVYVLDITGDPPSTCTTNCWTIQPISKSVGLLAARSVVSLGNDQWFLSSDPIAIRSLVRTNLDKILVDNISTPIQDIFDGTGTPSLNRNMAWKAAAVLHNNKYFLAIPTGDSTVNNTVLIYDFNVKGWTIISGWSPAYWQIFDSRLFFADANVGRVIEVLTGTRGDFAASQVSIISTTVPAQPIPFFYITKAIDFDQPENFKSLDAIEVEMEASGNYTATVSINIDDGGWIDVGTINLSSDAVTLPTTFTFTAEGNLTARKTFQVQQYGEFKKIKVRVRQEGLGQLAVLQRITIFGRVRPWRRE